MLAEMKDCYKILGVRQDATREEIDRAHREKREGLEDTRELDEAHEVLSDPASRERYDKAVEDRARATLHVDAHERRTSPAWRVVVIGVPALVAALALIVLLVLLGDRKGAGGTDGDRRRPDAAVSGG
jgi:curved DNA-binding protein CbpA